MDELPAYEYNRLSHPSDIRLINLHPASEVTSPIIITISHHKRLSFHLQRLFNIDSALQNAKRHLEIVRMQWASERAAYPVQNCDGSIATAYSSNAERRSVQLQERIRTASTIVDNLEGEHKARKCDQIHEIRKRRKAGLPRYEAVSYAWGTEKAVDCINHLSGTSRSSLDVQRNVAEILRYLRDKTSSRCLWIDSICINQTDTEEKECQVRQMGQIYADAVRVLVWLGLHFGQFDPNPNVNCSIHNGQGDEKVCEACIALSTRDLIRQEWFYRRWIIQEVALACEARVICGGYVCVEFQEFVQNTKARLGLFDTQLRDKGLTRADRDVLSRLDTMATLQSTNSNQFRPRKMRDLLLEFSTAKCSDPRDILFALNSLCIDPVFVSYSQPVHDLFTEFARRELEIDPSALLACAGAFPAILNTLPSWVPDWRALPLHHPLGFDCYANLPQRGGFTTIDYANLLSISRKTLDIMAARVDEVEIVCPDCLPSAWGRFYQKHSAKPSLENHSNLGFTFFETITAGLAYDSNGDHSKVPVLLSRGGKRTAAKPEDMAVEWYRQFLDSPSVSIESKKRITHMMTGRACFFSKWSRVFGTGPCGIRKGDILVCLPGRSAFLALRPQIPQNEATKSHVPAVSKRRMAGTFKTFFSHDAVTTTLVGECYAPELVRSQNFQTLRDLEPFSII